MNEENEVVEEVTEQPEESGSLLSESVELADGEWLLSEGVKGVGDKPDYFNSDKFKTLADQAKGHSELHKMIGSFTGKPKDGYELAEGLDKDDALMSEVLKFAEDSNMSQEALNKLVGIADTLNNVNEDIDRESELAKLGDNSSERIQQVANALRHKFGDGFAEVESLVNTADSVLLAEKLIKAYAPTKLPIDGGDHPEGLTWGEIEKEMHKKDENGRPLRSTDPSHNAKVERMMQEYGGKQATRLVIG